MKRFVLSLCLLASVLVLGSGAGRSVTATDPYIQRFLVNWSGGGHVLLSLTGSPWTVNCYLDPTAGDDAVTLSGRCRLKYLFILSRSIDAKLQYQAHSETYTGTYSVDGGPPALLSGRRSGNDLTVNVRWPEPVNGHLNAVIKIFNDGHRFTLTTIDPIGINGNPVTTSDLEFTAG
jgi:hypothetical protein